MAAAGSGKKKFPTTLVFIAVVFAFALWTYLTQVKGKEEKRERDEKDQALLPYSIGTITSVQLKLKDGGLASLIRDGDTWKVESPYKDLGDSEAIQAFLSSLSTEKTRDKVVEADNIAWATFGLDKPVQEVTIAAGDKTRKVEIGSVKAFDGNLYARLDGANKVVTLSAGVETVLGRDPRDFREKRFFLEPVPPKFGRIEIARGSNRTVLVKDDKGWSIPGDKMKEWPLDTQAVEGYLSTIFSLRGAEVVAEDKTDLKVLAARRLKAPAATIALTAEDGKKYEIVIAPATNAVVPNGQESMASASAYGSGRPVIMTLMKSQIDAVTKSADDFRDLGTPFRVNPSMVTRIAVKQEGLSVPEVMKEGEEWVVVKPDPAHPDRQVKREAIEEFLGNVSKMRAMGLAHAGAKPNPKGSTEITLYEQSGKKLVELRLMPLDAAKLYLTSSKVPGRIFEIDKGLQDRFKWNWYDDKTSEQPAKP